MNILKKIFSMLFKLSFIIIGIILVVWGITAINDYYSSDEYKYKAVIGKTFPIINGLSSLVDLNKKSSLKILENGDVSIKFSMSPIEERLFKSSSDNKVFFSLRDKDGFDIHSFILDEFTRTVDGNGDVSHLSYRDTFEESSRFGGLSKLQISLIHTDSVVVDSYIGLETLEPYESRQAALGNGKNSAEEKLSKNRINPSYQFHRKLDFSEKMSYENRIVKCIEIGMTYREMRAAVDEIYPRYYWPRKYHKKSKQNTKAYRYGDFVIYFDRDYVGSIEYEKL